MRPITGGELGETTLTAAAPAGATQITVASTAGLRPGVSIEVGQTKPDTEIATKITAINGNTLTLNAPLQNAHAAGEFDRSRVRAVPLVQRRRRTARCSSTTTWTR